MGQDLRRWLGVVAEPRWGCKKTECVDADSPFRTGAFRSQRRRGSHRSMGPRFNTGRSCTASAGFRAPTPKPRTALPTERAPWAKYGFQTRLQNASSIGVPQLTIHEPIHIRGTGTRTYLQVFNQSGQR
jgi:hypothetical protein